MIKLVTSSWMVAILSAVIYLGATVAFWKTPKVILAAPMDAKSEPERVSTGPSWEFANPEAEQLIEELKAEKTALQKKEQEISDLTQRLEAEQTELGVVTQMVHELQTNFDQGVVHVKADETANLKKLGKTYAAMSPDGAAKIFNELDDPSIVKIMLFMKNDENAAILEAFSKLSPVNARRAAALSERLRVASAETAPPK